MSIIDTRTALTESFVSVAEDRSRNIIRVVAPHDMYVGISGFKTSSLNVIGSITGSLGLKIIGESVLSGSLVVSGTIYDADGNAYSIGGGGGGGGAPITARYVTLATDSTLTQERVLTSGTGISISDGGAGSTVTISLSTPVTVANGGTGGADAATARSNLGVTATGADTTYSFRSNNLSDLSSASTARANLGLGTISTQSASNVSITGGSVTGIADLAVADGGTGASDAATARSNLGLGTISTQEASNVSITGGSVTGITDLAVADGGTGASDASTARSNLGLGSIATQNSNSVSITGGSISGITDLAVADGGTGASDAATARSNLGLGSIATQNSNNVSITGGSIVANSMFVSGSVEAYNLPSFVSGSGGVRIRRTLCFFPINADLHMSTFGIGGQAGFRTDGTRTHSYDADGIQYLTYTFTGTGNSAGVQSSDVGSSKPLTRVTSRPIFKGYIRTHSDITQCRIGLGFVDFTAGSMVNSDTPSKSYAGFQFSSVRGDTSWQAIASGSGNTTQRIQSTGVTVAPSTNYFFEVTLDPQGHFTGSISGNGASAVVTLDPGISNVVDLGIAAVEKATASVTRALSIYALEIVT